MAGKVGRPKTLNEKMTTVRCREGQRVLLKAMRKNGEPVHQVLRRVLKYYLKHHPKTKKKLRSTLSG